MRIFKTNRELLLTDLRSELDKTADLAMAIDQGRAKVSDWTEIATSGPATASNTIKLSESSLVEAVGVRTLHNGKVKNARPLLVRAIMLTLRVAAGGTNAQIASARQFNLGSILKQHQQDGTPLPAGIQADLDLLRHSLLSIKAGSMEVLEKLPCAVFGAGYDLLRRDDGIYELDKPIFIQPDAQLEINVEAPVALGSANAYVSLHMIGATINKY